MQLLSGNINYTVDELGRKLDLSRRSVYRYIDTFKEAGFVVLRTGDGVFKMTSYNKEYSDLSQLVYFSEEEAIVLSHLIENLDGTNALKSGLKSKLAAVYDSTSIGSYISDTGKSEIIEALALAIKGKRQVRLKGYASAHSGASKDYTLEPYKFTQDFVDIIAYDTAADANKIFKIARIGSAEVLGGWEFEDRHQEKPIDSFRMSGAPLENVRLRLTLRAKNLLTEEFPVTIAEVSPAGSYWSWEGVINAPEGAGRFALGLPEDVRVEEGDALKRWLARMGAIIGQEYGTIG